MAKIKPIGDLRQLRISLISLVCPMCGVEPGHACETAAGGLLEVIHVARIKAAAERDAATGTSKKEKPR